MMVELVEWLKRITIFMILCETILSFSPSKGYRRYIKPFVGMILLFRITVFLFGAIEIDWNKKVEEVFDHYEQSVSQYLENNSVVDEELKEEILNENITNISNISIGKIKIGEEE